MIEWRKIPGFPNYEVSNTGFVRNGHKIIGTQCRRDGYIKCSLTYKRFRLSTSVHRLVAMVFIPNLENKPCVNHKNCNRADNRVENLEWCGRRYNLKYSTVFHSIHEALPEINCHEWVLVCRDITNKILNGGSKKHLISVAIAKLAATPCQA